MGNIQWTNEEIDTLYKNYKLSDNEILTLLPNRTINSINHKCSRLGLYRTNSLKLTEEEFEIFNQYANVLKRDKLSELLPRFNLNQITRILAKYNLNNKEKTIIACTKCGKILEYNDSNFYISSKSRMCKDCVNKLVRIKDYKNKYGIILDEEKYLNTYDIIQWYNFLFITPNNKRLKMLPRELLIDTNLAILFNYVLNKNSLNIKFDLNLINKKFLIKNKLNYKINNKEITICDYIQITYSKFNIMPWNLNTTPVDYFDNKNNIIIALDWLCEKCKIDFEDIICGYFTHKLLRDNGLRSICEKFASINDITIFYIQNKYNLSITSKDIYKSKKLLSQDGYSICSSHEELSVFEFIKFNLYSNIEALGNSRADYFYNDKYNEKYYPDFKLNINKNKTVYLEYYGMYVENSNNNIFIDYYNKVKRKNEFYKSNTDIYFIDLYPKDLKNNFEGVKNKITSFFMLNFNIEL